MKKIVNINKRPIKLGDITLRYMDKITVNDFDIPEYIKNKLNTLEKLNHIKIYNYPDVEAYQGVKFKIETNDSINNSLSVGADENIVIIDEMHPPIIAEQEVDPAAETVPPIQLSTDTETEIETTTKKSKGRPKKVVEEEKVEEGSEEKEGNE